MTPDTSFADTGAVSVIHQDVRFHRSLCWGAILAGVVTAMGMQLLLLALGAGIGLHTFKPLTDQNPTENLTIGAAVAWSLCALAALFCGGWMAGAFSAGPKSGCLHGAVVWSTAMVISFLLVSTGGGLALGGAMKAVGAGLGMTGQAAMVAGGTDLAKTNAKQGTDQLTSYIDEATKGTATNAAPGAMIRAHREVGLAATRLFTPGNDINSADNQAAVVKALTEYSGMTEADAKKMVDEWVASYKTMQAEWESVKAKADQKARELADRSARELSYAATVSFFVLLLGLVVTMCAGICGAKKTVHHTTRGFVS